MYLEYFKAAIDEKRALANAVELSRITTALVPSIALVEIILRSDTAGIDTLVFFYPKTETTGIQRMLLNKIIFGAADTLFKREGASYSVVVKRGGNKTVMEELHNICSNYPWFAPVELVNIKNAGYNHPILSIRVPTLLADEQLTVEWLDRHNKTPMSAPLPNFPQICTTFIGQGLL